MIIPPTRWASLRIDRIQTFVAVAEYGGFTAAAQALGYPQPQISRHVAELERCLGTRLIDRQARPLRLTSHGKMLLEAARVVLRELSAVTGMIVGVESPVVIGMYPSAAALVFPRLLAAASSADPAIELTLREGTPNELEQALRSGSADIVLQPATLHSSVDGLREALLWTEPLVAVVPDTDAMAMNPGGIRLADLATRDIVCTGPASQPSRIPDEFSVAFAKSGVFPRLVFQTEAPQTLTSMVRCGLGIGVSNLLAMRSAKTDGLVVIPFAEDFAKRQVVARWRQPHGTARPALSAIVDLLAAVASGPVGNDGFPDFAEMDAHVAHQAA